MIPNKFELAHVTITFTSPMIVATGESSELSDAMCVRDPNGRPSIPGTSIAGALRGSFGKIYPDLENVIFGSIDHEGASHRSKLTVGWAHVHDEQNRPVSHCVSETVDDSVLSFLSAGVHRDFVRIGEFGAHEHSTRGKFEQDLVPRGARFTFMLMLDTTPTKDGAEHGVSLKKIASLLNHGSFRLGGQTRRGAGDFVVSTFRMAEFDLTKKSDFQQFSQVSFDLSKPSKLPVVAVEALEIKDAETHFQIQLKPKDFFLPGGGYSMETVFSKIAQDERFEHMDMFPVFERQVEWVKGKGTVTEPRFYIPSTAIKGVLRHRTLFYLRALYGEWDDSPGDGVADAIADCLFGTCKNDETDEMSPGCVRVSEPVLDAKIGYRILQHVSLDSFTQAPMTGALFGEVVLERTAVNFDIDIAIDWKFFERMVLLMKNGNGTWLEEQQTCFKAIRKAISDLTSGQLPLGGGSSRGHGCMKGTETVEGYNV